ncbi:MAG TPA: hypothetical protein VHT97_02205 [Acidimicrobiales bacterium]|jgi:hypothetical protein|nr:hypothetical protein [Acidimicrobiales bacterium]
MLGRKNYPKDYIDHCRSMMDAQMAAHRALTDAIAASSKTGDSKVGAALDAFEPPLFNHLVIVLDHYFVHRLVMIAGKDGNPLNEVRLLNDSLLLNNGVLKVDQGIKLDPAESVLGLKAGDPIRITEPEFVRLADAYFAEIEKKFL